VTRGGIEFSLVRYFTILVFSDGIIVAIHHAEGLVDIKLVLDTPEHVESENVNLKNWLPSLK
jgi:hypothetical protein